MSVIKVSPSCSNCAEFTDSTLCGVHRVEVQENYTCDRFGLKEGYQLKKQCPNCARNGKDSCAYPSEAAINILCSSWTPMSN